MDGIGPAQLRVKELIERIGRANPARDHPRDQSRTPKAKRPRSTSRAFCSRSGVDRLAPRYGLPIGGDLDYADEITLAKALEGRREL